MNGTDEMEGVEALSSTVAGAAREIVSYTYVRVFVCGEVAKVLNNFA